MFEDRPVPADPVDTLGEVRRPGGDQLDVRISPAHQFGGLQRKPAVIVSRAVAHLPWPVDLVAESPVGYFPRILPPVLLAQSRHRRVLRRVDVFDPLLRFGPGSSAEV